MMIEKILTLNWSWINSLSILAIFMALVKWRKICIRNYGSIPGPMSFPVIGSTWLYSKFGPFTMKKYHESSFRKYIKYGPVVAEDVMFNTTIYHLFDADDIQKILNINSEYPIRPPNEADVLYRKSRPAIYSDAGIVNENGLAWQKLRKILTLPLTRKKTLSNYSHQMNAIAKDMVSLAISDKNFRDLIYRSGLETVSAVSLERRMGFLSKDMKDDTKEIFEAISGYQTASNEAMYGLPVWKFLPSRFSSSFTKLCMHKDCLNQKIGQIVDETIKSGDFLKSQDVENLSILDQLLQSQQLKTYEVKTAVIDYITAGVDTIGNTALFAISLIAKNQKVMTRLQNELDDVSEFDSETTKKLSYLNACLMESFRMFPTASQLARVLDENTPVANDHVIRKGSVVLLHTQVACLLDKNFTRAKEFIPERWLSDRDPNWSFTPGLVAPFGSGRRMCPGKRLAEQEILILIANLFSKVNVEVIGEIEADFNFLLVPGNNFDFKLSARTY